MLPCLDPAPLSEVEVLAEELNSALIDGKAEVKQGKDGASDAYHRLH